MIIATGGTPNRGFLTHGQDLVADTWDVMAGSCGSRAGRSWSTTTTAATRPWTPWRSSWVHRTP
ncbi:hypothetical protein NKH77_53035 [Streptomyces sp. M19]